MPARGRASPTEQQPAWRRRYRYRNGIEGRISQAKRHGLRRTRRATEAQPAVDRGEFFLQFAHFLRLPELPEQRRPQGGPVHVRAKHQHRSPGLPPPGPRKAVAFHHAPGRGH